MFEILLSLLNSSPPFHTIHRRKYAFPRLSAKLFRVSPAQTRQGKIPRLGWLKPCLSLSPCRRYAGGSLPTLPRDLGNRFLDIVKLDDYQEPYQALKYAPYYSYSTVVMEMKDMMLNNKGSNINHSGMPVHGRLALFCTYVRAYHPYTYIYVCVRVCVYTRVYKYTGGTRSKSGYVCAEQQSIRLTAINTLSPCTLFSRPPPLPSPFLLCYIIRSGVREWCSWHIVRLCGTGTRHDAPAQPGRNRTRPTPARLHRRHWPGHHLLQDVVAR